MHISQLLEAAADTFGGLAAAKGVTLCIVSLLPDLERAVFIGDVRRLQQCVNNGVSNSIKFTEAGGTVTIRARRGDDALAQAEPHASSATESKPFQPAAAATATGWDTAAAAPAAEAAASPHASVVLEVEDSGVGLTADELHMLNQGEAYTQVGLGQLQGSGGTGLGLTITRELLKLHGGSRVRLDSAGLGHGSTFRLELVLPEAPEGTQVYCSPGLANWLLLAPSATSSEAPSNAPTPTNSKRRHCPDTNTQRPFRHEVEGAALAAKVSLQLPSRSTRESAKAVTGTHAESTPGGGTSGAPGAAKSKRQARPQLRFPPGFRVLHVEDDAVLRRTFELRVLKKFGVPFDVAVNGAEAVRHILTEKREYALVLMDNQVRCRNCPMLPHPPLPSVTLVPDHSFKCIAHCHTCS